MTSLDPQPRVRPRRRVPLWDNARWIAITLVVIGHGTLPLIGASDTSYSVYLFIYAFHMPVFVLVSGYFAKSGPPGPSQLKRVITDIVLPYLIFETIWTLVHWLVGGNFWLDYATASWTLWFLLSLAVWRIVLPYLVMLRYPLAISMVVSVFAGYFPSIDSTFSLSRTIALLPFFVFGWAIRQRQLTSRWLALPPRIIWRWRGAAIALFTALAVVIALNIHWLRDIKIRRFLLFDEAYPTIGYDQFWAGGIRLAVMVLAMVLALSFLALMPRRATWFTALGSATMYIYLLHSFLLYPLRETPVLAGDKPGWVLPAVIALCIAIAIVLSQPFIHRVFRPLVEPRARWLFRQEPRTETGTLVLPPDIRG